MSDLVWKPSLVAASVLVAEGDGRRYNVAPHGDRGHFVAKQWMGTTMLKSSVCEDEDAAKVQAQKWENALAELP